MWGLILQEKQMEMAPMGKSPWGCHMGTFRILQYMLHTRRLKWKWMDWWVTNGDVLREYALNCRGSQVGKSDTGSQVCFKHECRIYVWNGAFSLKELKHAYRKYIFHYPLDKTIGSTYTHLTHLLHTFWRNGGWNQEEGWSPTRKKLKGNSL